MVDRKGISYASSPLLPVTEEIDGNVEGVPFYLSSTLLWDLENYPGDVEAGIAKPLSTFIPTNSIEDFIRAAYVFQTGRNQYSTKKYVDPLALYLRTLKAPNNSTSPDPLPSLVASGQEIFDASCKSCHNGSQGETLQSYPPAVTNTPEIYMDPFVDYKPPHDLAARAYNQYVATLGPMTPQKEFTDVKCRALPTVKIS